MSLISHPFYTPLHLSFFLLRAVTLSIRSQAVCVCVGVDVTWVWQCRVAPPNIHRGALDVGGGGCPSSVNSRYPLGMGSMVRVAYRGVMRALYKD